MSLVQKTMKKKEQMADKISPPLQHVANLQSDEEHKHAKMAPYTDVIIPLPSIESRTPDSVSPTSQQRCANLTIISAVAITSSKRKTSENIIDLGQAGIIPNRMRSGKTWWKYFLTTILL